MVLRSAPFPLPSPSLFSILLFSSLRVFSLPLLVHCLSRLRDAISLSVPPPSFFLLLSSPSSFPPPLRRKMILTFSPLLYCFWSAGLSRRRRTRQFQDGEFPFFPFFFLFPAYGLINRPSLGRMKSGFGSKYVLFNGVSPPPSPPSPPRSP